MRRIRQWLSDRFDFTASGWGVLRPRPAQSRGIFQVLPSGGSLPPYKPAEGSAVVRLSDGGPASLVDNLYTGIRWAEANYPKDLK